MLKRIMPCSIGLALCATLITACGGGGSGGGGSTADEVLTGKFVDSAVMNLGYKTETQSGVTNSLGEFKYKAGEKIQFFIGGLQFPSAGANGILTSLDIAGTVSTRDATVVNINRLLQSLDKDRNPANGIEITDQAKQIATAIDFSVPVGNFELDPNVLNLVNNGGQTAGGLVSEASADSHFSSTLTSLGSSYSHKVYRMTYSPYDNTTIPLPTPCRRRQTPPAHDFILTSVLTSVGEEYSCSLSGVPQKSCIAWDLNLMGIYYDFGTTSADNIRGLQLLKLSDGTLSGLWVINIDPSIGGGTTDCGTVTGTVVP